MNGVNVPDNDKPGDPDKLVATSRQMADALRDRNPQVAL